MSRTIKSVVIYVATFLLWSGLLFIPWNILARNHSLPRLSYVDCHCILIIVRILGAVWNLIDNTSEHLCDSCALADECDTVKWAKCVTNGSFIVEQCSKWKMKR